MWLIFKKQESKESMDAAEISLVNLNMIPKIDVQVVGDRAVVNFYENKSIILTVWVKKDSVDKILEGAGASKGGGSLELEIAAYAI